MPGAVGPARAHFSAGPPCKRSLAVSAAGGSARQEQRLRHVDEIYPDVDAERQVPLSGG